jgi:hypothetical protein
MVTWQHLFRLLNAADLLKSRWATELRSYLKICGLDTFEGVNHQLTEPRFLRAIRDWREVDDYRGWQNAMLKILRARTLASLESWRFPTKKTSTGAWNNHIDPKVINRAKHAIAAWRIGAYQPKIG